MPKRTLSQENETRKKRARPGFSSAPRPEKTGLDADPRPQTPTDIYFQEERIRAKGKGSFQLRLEGAGQQNLFKAPATPPHQETKGDTRLPEKPTSQNSPALNRSHSQTLIGKHLSELTQDDIDVWASKFRNDKMAQPWVQAALARKTTEYWKGRKPTARYVMRRWR